VKNIMTTKSIIQSHSEFATSTNRLTFDDFAEVLVSSSSSSYAVTYFARADTTSLPRGKNGKLPRQAVAHAKEEADPAYKNRMELARAALAEDFSEVMPNSLAKLRLKKGMSQSQLAKAIGTSQPHIANIEAGKMNVYWNTVVRISDALAVPLDDLRAVIKVKPESNSAASTPLIRAL